MRTNSTSKRQDKRERGAALVTAVFGILLVTVIGFALVSSGLISNDIAKNSRQQTSAYYISEAGLQHAMLLINAVSVSQYTAILKAGDGVPNTGDELSTQPAARTPIPAAGLAIADGYYVVYVSDDPDDDGDPANDTNGILVIRSVGFGADGASVTTEAIVSTQPNRVAFLADGDMKITGRLTVHGVGAIIHSNGFLDNSSDICAENFISQTSSAAMNLAKDFSGATCLIPGVAGVNAFTSRPKIAPEIHDIPNLQTVFRPHADYIFKPDGRIYQAGSAMTLPQIAAAGLTSWVWKPMSVEWKYSSNTAPPSATYYAESCDMTVSTNDSTLVSATFITEGSLTYDGPTIQPKYRGWALVSANDIVMHGAVGVSGTPGIIYAYGQYQASANTTVYGWLQGANFRRADGTTGPDVNNFGGTNPVPSSGVVKISNVTDIYVPPFSASSNIVVLSRREIRY